MAKKLSAQERLAELHASHAVVQIGGKVRIVSWEPSELHPGVQVPVFSSMDEMKLLYANQSIAVKTETPMAMNRSGTRPCFRTGRSTLTVRPPAASRWTPPANDSSTAG